MTRVGAFRLALLALPAAVRNDLGAELEGTLLDAEQDAVGIGIGRGTGGSGTGEAAAGATGAPAASHHRGLTRVQFAREVAHVVRLGATLRSRHLAVEGTAQVVVSGLRRGLVWIIAVDLGLLIPPSTTWAPYRWVLPIVTGCLLAAMVMILVGLDRAAAGVGLIACLLQALEISTVLVHGGWLPPTVLVVCCLGVITARPRARPRLREIVTDAATGRRLLWLLAPPALLGLNQLDADLQPVAFPLMVALIIGLPLAAAVLLPFDPRLAIALAVTLGYFGGTSLRDSFGISLVVVPATVAAFGVDWFRRRHREAAPVR